LKSLQVLVAQKVAAGVYKGVTTSELDELAAETAAALTSTHPDYATVRAVCGRGALLRLLCCMLCLHAFSTAARACSIPAHGITTHMMEPPLSPSHPPPF